MEKSRLKKLCIFFLHAKHGYSGPLVGSSGRQGQMRQAYSVSCQKGRLSSRHSCRLSRPVSFPARRRLIRQRHTGRCFSSHTWSRSVPKPKSGRESGSKVVRNPSKGIPGAEEESDDTNSTASLFSMKSSTSMPSPELIKNLK